MKARGRARSGGRRRGAAAPRSRPRLATGPSAKNYRELVELAPVGVFSSTLDGRFLLVNDAFARMLGYEVASDLLRLNIPRDIYFDPADRQKIIEAYAGSSGIVRIETQLKKKDGSPLSVWFDGRVLRGVRGRTVGFEGFVHDLTDRKRAEEALGRSEERFRALVENSHEVTGLVDAEGRWIYVSASVRRLLGFEPEEILAMGRFGERVHPDDLPIMRRRFQALVEGGEGPDSIEFRSQHKNGTWRQFEVVGANRLHDPYIGAVVLNYRDITDRKRADLALRRSEERFRALVENSYEVVSLFDREGHWIYVSPSVFRIWGYTPEEMLGTVAFGERIHPDDVGEVSRKFQGLFGAPDAVIRMEFRGLHKDGTWRDIEAVAVNRLSEPSIGAVVTNLRDITERKRAENRLKRSYEMVRALAARMESVREDESARIARELHDEIGQSLTAIKIQLQTLQRAAGPASSFVADLEDGIEAADRALESVRNLALDLRPAVLDDLGLPAALRWYLDRQAQLAGFKTELSARLRKGRLSREIETACFRVVQEAVTNIVRHASARRVRVDLADDGSALLLAIQDDGIGFDVEAAQARARAGQSLGVLGMEERVSQLGGSLTISSVPSEGTRIAVRLPVGPSDPVSPPA